MKARRALKSGTNGSIWWTNSEGFFEQISQRVAWVGAEKNCSGFELLRKNRHFYGDLQRRRYRWGKWGINSTNFQLWDNSDLCRLRYTLVWQAKNPWTRWSYTVWGDRCCHSYKLSERSLVLRQTLDWHKCPALATRSLLCFFIPKCILLTGVEMWKYINLLSHPKFYTSRRCGTVEKSDKGRIFSHFPPSHNPCHSLLSHTLLRGVEVWKSPTKSGYCHTFPQVTNPLSFFS